MSHQTVIVLDFGGQYNQLIARRVRECGVYCEVKPYTTPLEQIRAMEPIGIIFTGGPNSVYDPKSPQVDPAIFTWGVPILGICYGCQLMAHNLGGRVTEAQDDSARGVRQNRDVFRHVLQALQGPARSGHHLDEPRATTWRRCRRLRPGGPLRRLPQRGHLRREPGLLRRPVHPEVNHTEHGTDMIRNFLYEVCGAAGTLR